MRDVLSEALTTCDSPEPRSGIQSLEVSSIFRLGTFIEAKGFGGYSGDSDQSFWHFGEQSMLRLFTRTCAVLGIAISLIVAAPSAHAEVAGMIVKTSDFDVTKTVDRLGIALERAGITVFSRIKHHRGAEKVGLTLRPTEVIIFGNPKLGTPLMQSNAAIGLDLPLKAVAWQAEDGKTYLAYNDPAWMATRYGITDKDPVFQKITGALNKFTDMATKRGMLPAQ